MRRHGVSRPAELRLQFCIAAAAFRHDLSEQFAQSVGAWIPYHPRRLSSLPHVLVEELWNHSMYSAS